MILSFINIRKVPREMLKTSGFGNIFFYILTFLIPILQIDCDELCIGEILALYRQKTHAQVIFIYLTAFLSQI